MQSHRSSIDQYESKLHWRVLRIFVLAMFVVTATAWSIDAFYGEDWHHQIIIFFDSFWRKAASEARIISAIANMTAFVGPYLLAQATFSILMIFVVVGFIVEMCKVADFSQPRKLILQPFFLFFAPLTLSVTFGIVYYYNGFNGKTRLRTH